MAERLVEAVAGGVGLGGVFRVVLVDEFHMLGGDPLTELEALCKMLSFYPEYRGWRLVATASEGWVLASRLESRLLGYGARVVLVEGLDEEHARALHGEYSALHGCSVDAEAYLGLVGGLPGYLPELCPLGVGELGEWVGVRIAEVERALVEALGPGESLGELVEAAYGLLAEGVEALDARLLRLGDHLTMANIAYPAGGLRYRPQLRVYSAILTLWRRLGRPPEPREVLEEARRSPAGEPRA